MNTRMAPRASGQRHSPGCDFNLNDSCTQSSFAAERTALYSLDKCRPSRHFSWVMVEERQKGGDAVQCSRSMTALGRYCCKKSKIRRPRKMPPTDSRETGRPQETPSEAGSVLCRAE